ncbi:hypothetical protein GCM10009717_33540 [Agromyces allii]|uniref:Uncharacterized protein n=1 Tax=Agromyces allii TaxID=393607 RepID=A0ABP5CJK8_9MICO
MSRVAGSSAALAETAPMATDPATSVISVPVAIALREGRDIRPPASLVIFMKGCNTFRMRVRCAECAAQRSSRGVNRT